MNRNDDFPLYNIAGFSLRPHCLTWLDRFVVEYADAAVLNLLINKEEGNTAGQEIGGGEEEGEEVLGIEKSANATVKAKERCCFDLSDDEAVDADDQEKLDEGRELHSTTLDKKPVCPDVVNLADISKTTHKNAYSEWL